MDDKKKKTIFIFIVAIALIILIGVGSTFAYFSASITANEVISATAAEFEIDLDDDVSLVKANLIPSIEEYVDITSKRTNAETGEFLKPYTATDGSGKLITEGTTCIDDNLREICSIYSFTIKNPNTTSELPLYITLNQTINTFENLYFKVLDNDLNEVISATQLLDDRYETYEYTNPETNYTSIKYRKDETTGEWVKKENFDELEKTPIVLTEINKTLVTATDENTPSSVTYHIVMWIMETHDDQTEEDSGKVFGARLTVSTGPNGTGITGSFASAGIE